MSSARGLLLNSTNTKCKGQLRKFDYLTNTWISLIAQYFGYSPVKILKSASDHQTQNDWTIWGRMWRSLICQYTIFYSLNWMRELNRLLFGPRLAEPWIFVLYKEAKAGSHDLAKLQNSEFLKNAKKWKSSVQSSFFSLCKKCPRYPCENQWTKFGTLKPVADTS